MTDRIFRILIFSVFLPALSCSRLPAQTASGQVMLDQVGFYPAASKIAVITGSSREAAFYLIRENTSDTVYRGRLSTEKQSANSSIKTRIADFSAFQQSGKFYISVADCCRSAPFSIDKNVHRAAAIALLKGFYFLRASTTLTPDFAGIWSRAAGHPDTAVLVHPSAASANRPAGTVISTPGGWYDAGDYNKYIVNSGITMGTLLSAYEDFSGYFDTLRTNIPSIGKGIPDLLNEILYNLRWMLTMQDPADGGVYHKCTNAAFDDMIMPEACSKPRWVVQKGTAATLDFAAVMAQAARITDRFKEALPGLSDSCLQAAKHAWIWALRNPGVVYDQGKMNQSYEPKITTGDYGDRKVSDEWYWAACELFITTREDSLQAIIQKQFAPNVRVPSWSETGMLGNYSLLRFKKKYQLGAYTDSIRIRLLLLADSFILAQKNNAFLTVMGRRPGDFVWGSNSVAANQGILLINAYLQSGHAAYLNGALSNLEYIFGRNATGYCFVTGVGAHSPMHPHHRPSIADGIVQPVPGLMVAGPNPGQQDHKHYDFHEPETSYTDADGAYACNEIAINWNAPLVYLANAVEALTAGSKTKK